MNHETQTYILCKESIMKTRQENKNEWLDFIDQQPKNNQIVFIKDIDTGEIRKQKWEVDHDYPPFGYLKSVWLPIPKAS